MFDMRKIQEQVVYDAVRKQSDAGTARDIVYGKAETASSESNADWVNSTMRRLEENFDKAAVKKIRMNCQCGYGMDQKLTLLYELKAAASSLEEFTGLDKAKAAGLFCENGELFLRFLFCPCPMLADVDKLASKTWCQCTTGYSKVLFEKAFGCPVEVELLKSIKAGDDICLMKIILHGLVWEDGRTGGEKR